MLEVDYELNRQEGAGHERVFHVDEGLKTINSNAIYIEAPNAKGKSTFLNILAIALYGDRLDETDGRISQSLQSDIKFMTERENQNYTFKVAITSKDGSIQLISTKDNPNSDDIKVKEIINGKEKYLPVSTFRDEYFLIYDIPEDPLNRITEILSGVKNQQILYKNKVGKFKRYLDVVKQEIALSRNDDEMEQIKKLITDHKANCKELKENIDKNNDENRILESFLALREHKRYVELSFSYEDNINRKGETKKKLQTNIQRFNTRYGHKYDQVREKITEIKRIISQVTLKIDNLFIDRNYDDIRDHIKTIKDADICVGDYQINKKIHTEIKYFKNNISGFLNDRKIKESGKIGSFYDEIIKILDRYKSIEITLPGTEKSIDELIILLTEEYHKNSKYKSIFDELNECIKNFNYLTEELNKLPKELSTLKMLHNKKGELSSTQIDEEQLGTEIDDLGSKLDANLEKVEQYKKMAAKHGILIDDKSNLDEIEKLKATIIEQNNEFIEIFLLDEMSILSEIKLRETEIKKIDVRWLNDKDVVNQYENKLANLEKREPHKYRNYSQKINKLSNTCDTLERNLIEYERIIQDIANETKLSSKIEIDYNEEISHYFAKNIPEFPYINEFIKPIKVDFLNKVIILDNERKIDMKDISTGQSMSMYIQALLNRPQDDKRKIIVIFDEVATMDSNSLKPIQTILKKHIEQNKVILSIFAKAVDGELKITELI